MGEFVAHQPPTTPPQQPELPVSLQLGWSSEELWQSNPSERLLTPPEEARLHQDGERFATPVDERGIVRDERLIGLVKAQVIDGYHWRGEADVHHLYWKSEWYHKPNLFNQQHLRLFRRFVELPVHKLLVPREFHNFLHQVTEPVEPPEVEHMHARVEGWNVAVRLWNEAKDMEDTLSLAENRVQSLANGTIRLKDPQSQEDIYGTEWYVEMMRKHFRGLHMRLGELALLPPEFQFVPPDYVEQMFDDVKSADVDPSIVSSFRKRVQRFGAIATRRAVRTDTLLADVA